MRQAFLIMAHNEFGVLQKLVASLDAAGNDIYIHIDRKVSEMPEIKAGKSELHILEERLDVRWGSVSQIRTELLLMESAHRNGPYDFYHILSGTHMPLVSLQEMNAFYESHAGQEVMRIWPEDPGDADFKLRRFHFFKCSNILWRACLKIQKVLGIRQLKNERFIKTDNWISISEKACSYLTGEKESILKKYRWSHCGDEYFAASELESAGSFSICNCPELLYVQFKDANPLSYSLDRLNELRGTGYVWGRKFHE